MRSDTGGPVARRLFERDDGPVELVLQTPVVSPDPIDADPDNPPWRCDLCIRFPDGEEVRGYMLGVDSVQALILAMAKARVELTREGRPPVRWLGHKDLGLDVPSYD